MRPVTGTRVAVVGAGVVGLACAWELAEAGADVVVLERETVGGGVSVGNTGWICPSITAPLPAPGMVREGIRQLATGGDAFVLRPRLDLGFARWLLAFRRSCARPRYEAGMRALLALNRRTVELYDRYADRGVGFELYATGLVVAGLTPAGLESYRSIMRRLRELGYEGEWDELEPARAAEVEPALSPQRIHGALHARLDRYVRPETFTAGLADALRRGGAEVRERVAVDAVERRNGGLVVRAGGDEVPADRVVVAAGLGSLGLTGRHGISMPFLGARGYSVTFTGSGAPPVHALYLAEAKLGISAYASSVRLAGVFELGANSTTPPRRALSKLVDNARPYLSGWQPDADPPPAVWAGLRPTTADGLPLIGAVPGREGVYVAAGHAMLGVTLAPATAAALAPLVLRGERPQELQPFDPGRRTP
jgi:D-amino-acid dehydrogenase